MMGKTFHLYHEVMKCQPSINSVRELGLHPNLSNSWVIDLELFPFVEKTAPREPGRMKVMKFIYGDLTPAKVSDLKQACKQEVGLIVWPPFFSSKEYHRTVDSSKRVL